MHSKCIRANMTGARGEKFKRKSNNYSFFPNRTCSWPSSTTLTLRSRRRSPARGTTLKSGTTSRGDTTTCWWARNFEFKLQNNVFKFVTVYVGIRGQPQQKPWHWARHEAGADRGERRHLRRAQAEPQKVRNETHLHSHKILKKRVFFSEKGQLLRHGDRDVLRPLRRRREVPVLPGGERQPGIWRKKIKIPFSLIFCVKSQEDKEKEEDGADEPQQRPLSGKQAREQRWKLNQ